MQIFVYIFCGIRLEFNLAGFLLLWVQLYRSIVLKLILEKIKIFLFFLIKRFIFSKNIVQFIWKMYFNTIINRIEFYKHQFS